MNKQWSWLIAALLLVGCAKSPTGRQQFLMYDQKQVDTLGVQNFAELKAKSKINTDKRVNQYVQCVAQAIVAATPAEYQRTPWEVVVFEDDQVNAFALPGGKIGVYTGLLLVTDNQHQLAAVLGHEVAHVMAKHANERLSSNQAVQGLMNITDVALQASNNRYGAEISTAMGLGFQFGVTLPYGRSHESEADAIGLDLMAKAGFKPEESVSLWQNMAKQGGQRLPQFLSTHPVPENRIKALQSKMAQANALYQSRAQSSSLPNCAKR